VSNILGNLAFYVARRIGSLAVCHVRLGFPAGKPAIYKIIKYFVKKIIFSGQRQYFVFNYAS